MADPTCLCHLHADAPHFHESVARLHGNAVLILFNLSAFESYTVLLDINSFHRRPVGVYLFIIHSLVCAHADIIGVARFQLLDGFLCRFRTANGELLARFKIRFQTALDLIARHLGCDLLPLDGKPFRSSSQLGNARLYSPDSVARSRKTKTYTFSLYTPPYNRNFFDQL